MKKHEYQELLSCFVSLCGMKRIFSNKILHMFDNVMLLAEGGHLAYMGPVLQVEQYFEALGYKVCSPSNRTCCLKQ